MVMIGGADLILPVRDGPACWDVVFRVVQRHWPEYVYHDANDPSPPARQDWKIPIFSRREILVYRDADAARSWSDEGATTENADSMLYLIYSDAAADEAGGASLTIVHHDSHGVSEEIIEEIRSGLAGGCVR